MLILVVKELFLVILLSDIQIMSNLVLLKLRLLLIESSLFSVHVFKNTMNNYVWTLIIWWKRKILIYFVKWCLNLNGVVLSFKNYSSFSFCSDFILKAAVVKTDEIRGLKQLFTPCFLLIGKKISKIISSA